MKLKLEKSTAVVPMMVTAYDTNRSGADIHMKQHDTGDSSVRLGINDQWFFAQDLREAAALFIAMADHLENK